MARMNGKDNWGHSDARARNRNEAAMTEYLFDHDRLDAYRVSIEYVANAFETSRLLSQC